MEPARSTPRVRRLSLTGRRYRHPSDVARLVFAGAVIAVLVLIDLVASDALRNFGTEFLLLVDGLPDAVVDGLVGLVQLLATVLPVLVVARVVRQRRWADLLIFTGAIGFAVAGMFAIDAIVDQRVPIDELGAPQANSWFIGVEYPPASLLAAIVALLVASSPQLPRRWRRLGWWFVGSMIVARALSATGVPLRSGLLVAVGAFAGSAALVVFGAPRRRVEPSAVSTALADVGIQVAVPPEPVGDGEPVFRVDRGDDDPLVVKVYGRDQRDTDLLITSWRAAMTKGLGDASAIRSPLRTAEAETLALALFSSAGARVVEPVAMAVGDDGETAMLALTDRRGRSLAAIDDGSVGRAALADLWRQVALLQQRRLAHRRLSAEHVRVDGDDIWFDDLHWADVDATDQVLGADVAELLVVTTMLVGADVAVGTAVAELPRPVVERALPLLQEAALTRATRRQLERRAEEAGDDTDVSDWLDELRARVADEVGLDQVDVAPVRRITVQGVVSLVGSAVLVWYVLSLASDWDEIWDAFTRAELIYVVPILFLAGATYLTGAMSLLGAVPIHLGFGQTTMVMFGQSYLNRFTPANAGGMAMRVRYLQLQGLEAPVAATSIGLTSAASGVAQGVMIVVFLIWGGASDRLSDFEAPAIGPILLAILGVGLVISIVMASTWGRQTLRPWLAEAFDKVRTMIRDIAADPTKMAQLFGGAALGKVANIAAFWLAAVAFDVDISFPKAGALYIIATTIGSAVPTPGGVGGVDAALTAALLGYGVGNADAAAIVLLFRMLTFWLPTLPGYVSLRWCQRTGLV